MATGTTGNPSHLIYFFNPGTANGNSSAHVIPFSKGLLVAAGTWNGATVTFFQSTPSGAYVPVNDLTGAAISMTSNDAIGIEYIVWNQSMYATISNAGGSTSLTITLQRIQ
jgi:hypothetical protein